MSEVKAKTRIDAIDLMEFLGMFFVIFYHFTSVSTDIINNPSIRTYFHFLMRCFMGPAVPLFFFSNGFLLINRPLDIKKHIKRIIRIVLVTVIWNVIYMLLYTPITGNEMTGEEWITGLLDYKAGWTEFMWYMGTLVCIYLTFPLLKTAFDHNRPVFYFAVAVCLLFGFGNSVSNFFASITNYFLLGIPGYASYDFFGMYNPLAGLFAFGFGYFALGCLFGGEREKIHEKVSKIRWLNPVTYALIYVLTTAVFGAYCVLVSQIDQTTCEVGWQGHDTLFTVITTLSVYGMATAYRAKGITGKIILAVSKNTMGIYFIHSIFLRLAQRWHLFSFPFANTLLYNALITAAALSVSLLAVLGIKRIPVLKYLVS